MPSNSAFASSTPTTAAMASGVGSLPVAFSAACISKLRSAFDFSSRHSALPLTETSAYDRPSDPRITRSTPAMRIRASVGDSFTVSTAFVSVTRATACGVSPPRDEAAAFISLVISGCSQVISVPSSATSSAVTRGPSPGGETSPFTVPASCVAKNDG